MKKGINKLLLSSLVPLCAGAMLLTACSASSGEQQAGTQTTSESSKERHANVAFFWMTPGLDPAAPGEDDYAGWVVTRLGVGETLVKLNDKLEIEPWLAESWKNVDDTTWEFKIRDGVKFSNGKSLDAEAVKLSLERAINNVSRAADLSNISSIEASGQTLTIKTTKAFPAMLPNFVEPVFSIIDATQSDEDINKAPIGTGPFVVTAFSSESTVDLEKNPDYWKGDVGLDTVHCQLVEDANSRAMSIQSGEMDLANFMPNSAKSQFTDTSKYGISSVVGGRVETAYMNHAETSPLSDIELRKAINYAVDKESYADVLGSTPAHSVFSDATPFGNSTLKGYTFDKEEAKKILDNAGYKDSDGDGYRENKDGSPMVIQLIQTASDGDDAMLSVSIQSDLKDVGLNLNINTLENMTDILKTGDFDMFIKANMTASTGDPQTCLYTRYLDSSPSNYTKFHSDDMEKLVEKLNTTFDMESRYKLAAEASQILLDDAADIYITNSSSNTFYSNKLKNVVQSPCDYYYLNHEITTND